jgi:hypothetical protein
MGRLEVDKLCHIRPLNKCQLQQVESSPEYCSTLPFNKLVST